MEGEVAMEGEGGGEGEEEETPARAAAAAAINFKSFLTRGGTQVPPFYKKI